MIFFPQTYFVPFTVNAGYVVDGSDALDRIYAQYRNKEKTVSWLSITMQLATQLSSTAQAVRVMYNIDSATGEQLNIIGRIVGISRNFIANYTLDPTFFAALPADPGEFGDESTVFSELSIDADATMSDDLYRIAIKSKIVKNNADASIDAILTSMNFILPQMDTLRLIDGEDMSFSIEFYGNISELERWALLNAKLIPKPQGVRFNGFLEGYQYVQSGDDSAEFGDTQSEFVGFTGV